MLVIDLILVALSELGVRSEEFSTDMTVRWTNHW
jgi:hypothetical protein